MGAAHMVLMLWWVSAVTCTIKDPDTIVQMVGQDVTLPCYSYFHESVEELEWRKLRIEVNRVEYDTVFHYKNNQVLRSQQHPDFWGRVELVEPQMRRQEQSVILRKVRTGDSGVYICTATHSNSYEYTVRQPLAISDTVSKPISRRPGQDCELRCHSPFHGEVQWLTWTKEDSRRKYRQVYRYHSGGGESVPEPGYGARVELRDPRLSGGELSLLLQNLTHTDSGIYTCTAGFNTSQQYVHHQWLTVADEPEAAERQNRGIIFVLELLLLVTVTICLFIAFIYRKTPSTSTQ